MLHEEESLPRITTSCSDLDNILGGGISCRDVTEIGMSSPLSFFLWSNLRSLSDLVVCLFSQRWGTRDWQDSDWVNPLHCFPLLSHHHQSVSSSVNFDLVSGSSSLWMFRFHVSVVVLEGKLYISVCFF